MMARAFIGVGSNIDSERNVLLGIQRLAQHVRVAGVSTVYRTAPIGRPEQADYYNCVVAVETALPPLELSQLLHEIERELGRRRTDDRYAARCIDLDLIVYDDLVLHSAELKVPDPDILTRAFLAAGLCELAPTLVLPDSGRSVSEVAAELQTSGLTPLPSYTTRLREVVRQIESRA